VRLLSLVVTRCPSTTHDYIHISARIAKFGVPCGDELVNNGLYLQNTVYCVGSSKFKDKETVMVPAAFCNGYVFSCVAVVLLGNRRLAFSL
jgi:hypothetical protein